MVYYYGDASEENNSNFSKSRILGALLASIFICKKYNCNQFVLNFSIQLFQHKTRFSQAQHTVQINIRHGLPHRRLAKLQAIHSKSTPQSPNLTGIRQLYNFMVELLASLL